MVVLILGYALSSCSCPCPNVLDLRNLQNQVRKRILFVLVITNFLQILNLELFQFSSITRITFSQSTQVRLILKTKYHSCYLLSLFLNFEQGNLLKIFKRRFTQVLLVAKVFIYFGTRKKRLFLTLNKHLRIMYCRMQII